MRRRLEARVKAAYPNWRTEFVVDLALRDSGSVRGAAAALGVAPNTLRTWIRENGYEVIVRPLALLRKRVDDD